MEVTGSSETLLFLPSSEILIPVLWVWEYGVLGTYSIMFRPEDGGSIFRWKFCKHLSNITESQTGTPETTSTQKCKYFPNTISDIYNKVSRYSNCKTSCG